MTSQALVQLFIMCSFVAWWGRRRGYSFLSSLLFLAVALTAGPLTAIFLLALLPDQVHERERQAEKVLLDKQLAGRMTVPREENGGAAAQVSWIGLSINDMTTVDGSHTLPA